MAEKKIDNVEKAKRIRIIMEWILEDWPSTDIITQVVTKWGVSDRQAKRYLADARTEWVKDEDAIIEQRRRTKVESLKKLKRSLKEQFKGTPLGIRSVLMVEREIILLEGLRAPAKIEHTGAKGEPLFEKLTDDELMAKLLVLQNQIKDE
jgi:hypothetical protein